MEWRGACCPERLVYHPDNVSTNPGLTFTPGAMHTNGSNLLTRGYFTGHPRWLLLLVLFLGMAPLIAQSAGLEQLKVGVVDINRALNQSMAGDRSKKLLLATRDQKENELKGKEQALKKLSDELQNSLMMTESARREKEQELRDKETALRMDVQRAQQELQEKERKMTETIFGELKMVVEALAKEGKYDLVLEQGASQVILFHVGVFTDLTDQVIARYNKMTPNK